MAHLRQLLPSLNALVAFEAAVRCGTFANAAKYLGVTGPAVSRTIGRLELHLGVLLFRRTPSGCELTEEGKRLFCEVTQIFTKLEETVLGLKRSKASRMKTVRLSVSAAFATHWFMPRMKEFEQAFPGIEIEFELINGFLDCAVHDCDIAMRFDPAPDGRYRIYPLMPEILLPVHAPGYGEGADADGTRFEQIITLSGSRFNWADMASPDAMARKGRELNFSDYTVVVQAALMGQGIALGWFSVISRLLVSGALLPARPVAMATGRRCDLVTSITARRELVDEICDWILEQYRVDAAQIKRRYPRLDIVL